MTPGFPPPIVESFQQKEALNRHVASGSYSQGLGCLILMITAPGMYGAPGYGCAGRYREYDSVLTISTFSDVSDPSSFTFLDPLPGAVSKVGQPTRASGQMRKPVPEFVLSRET